eukprot:CAMPEP_0175319188 /NCGR_PEP_ID=MMETSP0093-20121207/70814_1 /TAXON_ID=311494 /ORGANISM="Alexandrium monilatum, Strain CCMP3105" /LENGTH=169 /DNA_ID=CAMNT_0016616005 /DNA_START=44 /DNA_END=554 /DNA_ORIENTATION=+
MTEPKTPAAESAASSPVAEGHPALPRRGVAWDHRRRVCGRQRYGEDLLHHRLERQPQLLPEPLLQRLRDVRAEEPVRGREPLVADVQVPNYGVGIVLVLIGVKLMLSGYVEVGMSTSCGAILAILFASILASVVFPGSGQTSEHTSYELRASEGRKGVEAEHPPTVQEF